MMEGDEEVEEGEGRRDVNVFHGICIHYSVFVCDKETQEKLLMMGYGATKKQDPKARKTSTTSSESAEIEVNHQSSPLLLLDEEALFLSLNGDIVIYELPAGSFLRCHGSGSELNSCYDISSFLVPEAKLSPAELYALFYRKNSRFPLKYKVYSYFRQQGCCVHTAVNYGLDYAIYQTLPSLCHSAFSVLVIDGVTPELSLPSSSTELTNQIERDVPLASEEETLRWTHISAMTRVMGDVSKLLLLCHVVPTTIQLYDNLNPIFDNDNNVIDNKTDICLNSLRCLDFMTVKPVTAVVRRHVADSSARYMTVESMQKDFASNIKSTKGRYAMNKKKKTDSNGENKDNEKSGQNKKRKRKDISSSGPNAVDTDREVKVSRHAKLWRSLYAPELPNASVKDEDLDVKRNNKSEDTGGIFGWLGSIFFGDD